jgi:heterodisulfide reductase subunit C
MNDAQITVYGNKERCVKGDLPPCSCGCPINFKVRDFMKKLRAGNVNGAYREMANRMLFPAIIPYICEGKCLKHCVDEIDIPALELACIKLATKKTPNHYLIPQKTARISVIGGGLAGLACTLRLASKHYNVTLFEKTDRIGGSLHEVMASEYYLNEFELQFRYAPYEIEYHRQIQSLDELSFDAVVIATGKDGDDFGMSEGWDAQCMATRLRGVFLCGRLSGVSHMDALAQGNIASFSVERYLKTGSMSGEKETFIIHSTKLPQKEKKIFYNIKADISAEEDARQEALRCSMCDCTACCDSCEFLKFFKLSPKQIERNALAGVTANMGLLERDALSSRMIYSCGLCGHCRGVCPENLPIMEEFMLQNKIQMFNEGNFAPALHDFYLRDMEDAMGQNYFTRPAPGCTQATYLLFPGCQVTASSPAYAAKSYEYLRGIFPDTAFTSGCCGITALWAGNRHLFQQTIERLKEDWKLLNMPTVIVLCSTCLKTFDRYAPEIKKISLYELICENGLPKYANIHNIPERRVVFDPCSSRDFPAMQSAVRHLAMKCGSKLEEIDDSGKRARCCGMSGHTFASYPELTQKNMERAAMLSDSPYIAYCANCRNLFLKTHKKCAHILDDLFDLAPLEKAPHIAQMRKNRSQLKTRMLSEVWGENIAPYPQENLSLNIAEDILDKMDKNLISEDEVQEVIKHCEKTGYKLIDKKRGTMLGYLQIGVITYWVEYREDGSDYEIVNAYCHRMRIKTYE